MSGIEVRGTATPEELAAVLAVLARSGRDEGVTNGYDRWRATRRQALRRAAEPIDRPT